MQTALSNKPAPQRFDSTFTARTRAYPAKVRIGNIIVTRGCIIGTRHCIYDVYELTEGMPQGHSTIQHFDEDGWGGRLGTQRLTAEIDAIPVGQARFDACDKFRAEQYEQAYALILAAYPHIKGAENFAKRDGEINTTEAE